MDFVIEQLSQYTLQLALYGRAVRLNLPTVKWSAIVSNGELEVPHSYRL